MSVKTTYTCDGCGVTKGETNHWIGLQRFGGRNTIYPTLNIRAFDDSGPDDSHYCGQECALKAVSAFMEELQAGALEFDSAEPKGAKSIP